MSYINKGKGYLETVKDKLDKFHEWSDTKGYLPPNKIVKVITDHTVLGIASAASLAAFLATGEFHPAHIVFPAIGVGADAVKNKGIDVMDKQISRYLPSEHTRENQ